MNRTVHRRCTCPPNRNKSINQSPAGLQGLERFAFAPRADHVLPGNAIPKPVFEPTFIFPFKNLFPELRAIIYEMHFFQEKKPGTIGEFCPAGDWCPNRVYNNRVPVRMLLMVSKSVYAEAMPIFYRKPLHFNNIPNLNSFLERIGPAQSSHLQHISFTYSGFEASKTFFRLGMCSSLRHLEITVKKPVLPEKKKDLMNLMGVGRLLSSIRGLSTITVDLSHCPKDVARDTFVEALEALKLPKSADSAQHGGCEEWEASDQDSLFMNTEDDERLTRDSLLQGGR